MKGFKYDKFKEEANSNDSWGSYSDLFMVLSFVFLMMYVVSSLRSGTSSIQQRLEKQRIARDNDDLRAQIKAYNTLKDSALQEESEDEQEVYGELMDKLTLLQEDAKEEKNQLRRQAMENEKKEMALNKYQQVVRNIINANLLAKNKLKVREEIISNKNEEIGDLNQEIETKEDEIAQNNNQIKQINKELMKNISELEKAQKNSKITKHKAYEQISRLKKKGQEQIAKLNQENREVQDRLAFMNQELSKTSDKLVQTETALATTSDTLQRKVGDYESQIQNMKSAHDKKMSNERQAFESKLKAANLTASQKAEQLADFNRESKAKSEALGKEIAGLKGNLAEATARADARAKLSKEIAKALKSAGVDADVNPNTGDVTISFNGDYFDSGSSKLKQTMAKVLHKFIPKYSESLFKDAKIASKITSVDIVGFASPTYQNKYIDPQSLDPEDQKAAKYNLDLSYKRARSIFDYMFDTNKISYKNQKQLLPLVKVTGRSFFTEGRAPAGAIPGMDQKEFCKKFDCKQSQKVIIKFNMDDKK